MASRFLIGIDLGTTNSALAYLDSAAPEDGTRVLAADQLESAGRLRAENILPSAIYLAPEIEQDGRYNLDFQPQALPAKQVVGMCARSRAGLGGARVIHSAKSWLCHPNIDRNARLLPWGSDEPGLEKLSAVEASACILRHFKDAWNVRFGAEAAHRFERQEICITVPASFDEVAQRLTLEAAAQAGYPETVRLLEEPQAAFYYWLELHRERSSIERYFPAQAGRSYTVLVVDIGGGTTDLTLFEAGYSRAEALPAITRVAVSDHLLLGGDNIDLTLAYHFEPQLASGGKLARGAWNQLVMQCRALKERALSGALPQQQWHVSVTGGGSGLFAAGRSAGIGAAELEKLILEGFFPLVDAQARPSASGGGLRELGLPYAADSAITRHLAAFLQGRRVDAMLCNGGALKPEFLQQRLLAQVAAWQSGRPPQLLPSSDMDLAVAHGAAWYGYLLHRPEGRIRAGYAHAIYLKVAGAGRGAQEKLLCVLPQGSEPGTVSKITGRKYRLLVNQPAAFELYRSSQERFVAGEQSGDLIDLEGALVHALPPMQVRLGAAERKVREVEVELEADLSETGLLRLFCVSAAGGRWELQFNLRRTDEAADAHSVERVDLGVEARRADEALKKIELVYGKAISGGLGQSPKGLARELERTLGMPKSEWNLGLLRLLWTALAPGVTKRSRSLVHEVVWLPLAGFVLRPGYGADLDRFRIAELWRAFEVGLYFKKERSALTEWWIMWRRVCGGLDAGRQTLLFDQTWPEVESGKEVSAEAVRLLGALERVDFERKQCASELFLKRLASARNLREPLLNALGRIGSRVPLYAGLEAVVPPSWIEQWYAKLNEHDWREDAWRACRILFSHVCRRVPTRDLEVSSELRAQVLAKLREARADQKLIAPVEEILLPDAAYRAALFGEALPIGLRMAG